MARRDCVAYLTRLCVSDAAEFGARQGAHDRIHDEIDCPLAQAKPYLHLGGMRKRLYAYEFNQFAASTHHQMSQLGDEACVDRDIHHEALSSR